MRITLTNEKKLMTRIINKMVLSGNLKGIIIFRTDLLHDGEV